MNRNETVEKFYRKNYKNLVSSVKRSCPNNSIALAEEVVQNTFADCLQYWNAFDPEKATFPTWFGRILRSNLSRCIQAEGGGNTPSLNGDVDLEPFIVGDDVDIPLDIVIKVKDAIKAEGQPKQDILHMFFNLGMRTPEISAVTGISPKAIAKLVSRWRIKWNEENIFVS